MAQAVPFEPVLHARHLGVQLLELALALGDIARCVRLTTALRAPHALRPQPGAAWEASARARAPAGASLRGSGSKSWGGVLEREKSEDLWSAAPAGAYKHIKGAAELHRATRMAVG